MSRARMLERIRAISRIILGVWVWVCAAKGRRD
jgi:hypothetical protein